MPDLQPYSPVRVKHIIDQGKHFILSVEPREANENFDIFPDCVGVVTYFNNEKKYIM